MGYSLVMYEDKVYLGDACGVKLNRIMSKHHTDFSSLTVAMQKKEWWKYCSKCFRLRYTIYGETIKAKNSQKRKYQSKNEQSITSL